jgi:hypothetical protein
VEPKLVIETGNEKRIFNDNSGNYVYKIELKTNDSKHKETIFGSAMEKRLNIEGAGASLVVFLADASGSTSALAELWQRSL